jgi:hypothetical protein
LCGLTLVLITCALVLAVPNRYPASDLYFLMTEVSATLVGGLIAWRQPRNPVGWFIIGHALCFTLGEFGRQYAIYGVQTEPGSLPLAGAVASLAYWAWFPGLTLTIIFLPLYFPDGRLVSRRWRPVAWLGVFVAVISTAFAVVRPSGDETRGIPNPLGIEGLTDVASFSGTFEVLFPASWVLVGLLAVGSLVVRFVRARGLVRQQMKWFVYAAVLFISWSVVAQISPVPIPPLVDNLSFVVTLQALWVAIGFAVLNYRLYAVDLVVNRTLVYTALTAVLALAYFGAVAALQLLLRPLPGDESQLAVVASTLSIAALFNPLRRRTQRFIDRMFYRRKYDAAETLEAFSARLREETDLDRLGGELVSVVHETMQPEHASLWLRHQDDVERDERGPRGV